MEPHQKPMNDPIAEKLRDTAALEKVMQQAVIEAVDNARKLGFLPDLSGQENVAEYKAK